MAEKELVGTVIHVFNKINVGVVALKRGLREGDRIWIESSEPFEQAVSSMQVEHAQITEAKPGQEIGLKFNGAVHKNNKVYKLVG